MKVRLDDSYYKLKRFTINSKDSSDNTVNWKVSLNDTEISNFNSNDSVGSGDSSNDTENLKDSLDDDKDSNDCSNDNASSILRSNDTLIYNAISEDVLQIYQDIISFATSILIG